MIKFKKSVLAWGIIILMAVFLQFKYVREFPSHVHAWSQSDRYALALGFERNNLNFFKPETYVQNHQFPGDFKKADSTSITSVDFPIHDYIPAVIMKISGSRAPIIFRLYILLFSLLGLFYLYRLAFLFNQNFTLSMFVVVFAATSPAYAYYQSGFIPTIPSISLVLIGCYLWVNYGNSKSNSHYVYSILFMTIAALSRTPFVIPLVALMLLEIYTLIFHKNEKKNQVVKLGIIATGFLVFAGYFLYNVYLRNTYGSIFLNQLLPARSVDEAKDIFRMVRETWKWQYFSKWHYLIFALVFISGVVFWIKGKLTSSNIQGVFFLFISACFCGALLFALAMFRQFPAHDYYFLDSFFVPIILALVLLTSYVKIPKKLWSKSIGTIVLTAVSIPLIINASKMQESRRVTGDWDRIQHTIQNYQHSAAFLDSLNIPKNAKILAIDAYAPNIPFILMDRKGYAVMTTSRENLIGALAWDFDFVVIQNEYFITDVYNEYPEIVTRLRKVADNGKISVCKRSNIHENLFEFLELDKRTPIFSSKVDFDNSIDFGWSNATPIINQSNNYFGGVSPAEEFGITFKSKKMEGLQTARMILLTMDINSTQPIASADAVCSVVEGDKSTYYYATALKTVYKNNGQWQTVQLQYFLPAIASDNYELGWYIWNKGKETLRYDNVRIEVY
jgi:hypothetical protein